MIVASLNGGGGDDDDDDDEDDDDDDEDDDISTYICTEYSTLSRSANYI